MINYTWEFPALGVVYNEDNMMNVIQTVNWILYATEDTYSASCYGSVTLATPSPSSFTPYDQVSQAQVQAWTEAALGPEQVQSYKDSLALQIANQKNPKGGDLPPPWVQS